MSLEVRAQTAFSGIISPVIAANQNDWAPAGLPTATVVRVNGGAVNRTITGIAGLSPDRLVFVVNVGTTNSVIFSDENVLSLAANRFALANGVNLSMSKSGGSAILWYDSTTGRIRALAHP